MSNQLLDVALKAPDPRGRFGTYGGRYVPETLIAPLDELAAAYDKLRRKKSFQKRLADLLANYVGRPTPLYFAERLSEELGGARIFFKREDLLHTGAHKINNALGQALLTKEMGKTRVIAETGAGQHGVATATAAALLGLDCVVYMGEEDMRRQRLNVYRMQMLGAEVRGVDSGSRTLKDAINEAMRDWVTNVDDTHYILGSVLGPEPFPRMVRDFHSVIGEEATKQLEKQTGSADPDMAIACVGGGSNAIGLFRAFLPRTKVKLIGVEAGGRSSALGEHAARFPGGKLGVLHGTRTLVLQDDHGQVSTTHSISAGLDYPAVGPEHVYLKEIGRVQYTEATDEEALAAFHRLASTEGILAALETSHAVAEVLKRAPEMTPKQTILVNLSGRGDKDVESIIEYEAARKAKVSGPVAVAVDRAGDAGDVAVPEGAESAGRAEAAATSATAESAEPVSADPDSADPNSADPDSADPNSAEAASERAAAQASHEPKEPGEGASDEETRS